MSGNQDILVSITSCFDSVSLLLLEAEENIDGILELNNEQCEIISGKLDEIIVLINLWKNAIVFSVKFKDHVCQQVSG